MENFIKIDAELPLDLYSLDNNNAIWNLSPLQNIDPICAMLSGLVNIKYKHSDIDKFNEYKEEIDKKYYYNTLVGFGKSHLFITYYAFDEQRQIYLCKYFLALKTNQFKKIIVQKNKLGTQIIFYKNMSNYIDFIFNDKGRYSHQKDLLSKIKMLAEKQVFIKQ